MQLPEIRKQAEATLRRRNGAGAHPAFVRLPNVFVRLPNVSCGNPMVADRASGYRSAAILVVTFLTSRRRFSNVKPMNRMIAPPTTAHTHHSVSW